MVGMGADGYEISATKQLFLVLALGFASSVVCGFATCTVSSSCTQMQTCERVPGGFCSFKNRVGIATDASYLFNASADALAGLLRGICSPGDRVHTNAQSGEIECVPHFPFPNAINVEIMDSTATTPAGKACGKWIDAGGIVYSVHRRGAYDNENWIKELERVEDAATSTSRLAHSGMAKFRAECQRTATAGASALRSSAAMAFRYFKSYVDTNAVDRNGFLRSLGFMNGHYCATPLSIGYDLTSSYRLQMFNGQWFGPSALSDSLLLFNELGDAQTNADDANRQIRDWFLNAQSSNMTAAERYHVMLGASELPSLSYEENIYSTTTLGGAALRYYDENPKKAISYLKGLGAFCSFGTFFPFVDYDSSPVRQSVYARLKAEMQSIRASRPAASAFGRLRQVGDADEASAHGDALKASSVTVASVVGDGSTGKPGVDCLGLMRLYFIDEVEAAHFERIVPPDLYSRLQSLLVSVRAGIGLAAETAPLNATIANTTTLEGILANAGVRVVGAPRGSWAGESRAIPSADLSSTDGVFMMLLKQARALYKHNLVDPVSNPSLSVCDHQALYGELVWNAYAMRASNNYCSVFSLGIAHRPLMDPLYDDASLASRSLFVFAHELAHFARLSGLVSASSINANALLKHYDRSTYNEAHADVFAAVAILKTGIVTRAEFDIHHCQVWCSREPPWWHTRPTNPLHPFGNDRCNFLIKTLDEFYPSLGR